MAKRNKNKANAEAKRRAAAKAARRAKLQWMAVIGAGVLIVGGFILYSIIEAIPEDGDVGATTWDLPARANDPDGDGRIMLSEFEGQPVVLNFYADWCSACRSELPAFAAVSEQLRGDVQFVHVNTREEGSWRSLPEEFGTDWWPIARDINGNRANGSGLWQTLDGAVMPITAFYDAQGRLVYTEHGGMTEGGLRAVLGRELGVAS